MKQKQVLSALMLAFLPLAAQAQFPVLGATSVSDMRLGPNSGGPNTGVFKWTASNELGIFTWADGKPIRIGGTSVKFQHESGNPNDVFMFGNLAVGSGTLTTNTRLSIVGSATKTIGATATLSAVVPASQADGFIAEVNGNNYNQGFRANTSGGLISVGGEFDAASSSSTNTGVVGKGDGGNMAIGGNFSGTNSPANNYGIVAEARIGPNSLAGDFRAWQSLISTGVSGIAQADHTSTSKAIGGNFHAQEGSSNKGVNAEAIAYVGHGNYENIGVDVDAEQYEGTNNYGVRSNAIALFSNTVLNAGIWSRTQVTSGACINYGVYSKLQGGATPPNPATGAGSYAGYFYDNSALTNASGAAFFNGPMLATAPGTIAISDRKFKNDITAVGTVIDKIMKLSPVTYTFKSRDEFPSFTFPKGKQLGFIAQELEQVFPELVHESVNPAQFDDKGNKIADKVDFKGVEYTSLIPVLTKAIQEQQTQIDAQQTQMEAQQKQIEELKAILANNNSGNNNTGISNDQNDPGSLSQNVPNPFSQNTVIGYKLPVSAKSAAIGIYDLNGREIKLVTLDAERTGSVTIDGGTMPAGMYVYTLIVNGNPFATKKMILTSH